MSATYRRAQGIFVGVPPCAECGANWHLHRTSAGEIPTMIARDDVLLCPTPWRPGSLEEAMRVLAEAERSGDQARVFVARGDLQRLEGVRK